MGFTWDLRGSRHPMENSQAVSFWCYFFIGEIAQHLGVSKNHGTPKWMVKIMENPIKMDDLGIPLFLETPTFTDALKNFYGYLHEMADFYGKCVCRPMDPMGMHLGKLAYYS